MQLRVAGMGSPIGLDYGAVMAVGTARRADLELLSEVLPAAEAAILESLSGEPDEEGLPSPDNPPEQCGEANS